VISSAAAIAALTLTGSCRNNGEPRMNAPSSAVLRVGVAQLSATNPISGLRQLRQNLSVEGLARVSEDGRVEPSLAEKWTVGDNGRTLNVTLKSGVKFHDGSPVDSQTVAAALPGALRGTFGPIVEDIERITPANANSIDVEFRRPSPFLLEALEVPLRKPGSAVVGTGPFMVVPDSTTEMRSNADYYLGRSQISALRIETFPSVRSAWAELLRNRLDMLYEVGPDALDSLESSTSVAVFKFTRRYQYLIAFNTDAPNLRSSAVRRALNMAIDRGKIVHDALNDHGLASSGPVWPRYWALQSGLPVFRFDPKQAAETLEPPRRRAVKRPASLRFACLVPSDAVYERLALEVKRQFEAVDIDMDVRAASQDQILEAEKSGNYEAVLIEGMSGPTLLRPYQVWHSKGAGAGEAKLGNSTIDAAFDRVRYAESEANYRQAVAGLQQAFLDDPPAIFLAWIESARAVSKRFEVPALEPGRDVLGTMRLWTPNNRVTLASRN
jgi:peptide/nickel transport system substrate-binding protein